MIDALPLLILAALLGAPAGVRLLAVFERFAGYRGRHGHDGRSLRLQPAAPPAPAAGSGLVKARVRLSASDRLSLAFFGIAVGGTAAWGAWWLVGRGELLLGIGVSTLAVVGALALWSGVTGR